MFEKEKKYTQKLLDESGLVCTITDEEEEEREPNIIYLRKTVSAIDQSEKGYKAIFPYKSSIAKSILQFILKEHDCCPFFPFEISFYKEESRIEFKVVTEGNDNKETIESIFKTVFKN